MSCSEMEEEGGRKWRVPSEPGGSGSADKNPSGPSRVGATERSAMEFASVAESGKPAP